MKIEQRMKKDDGGVGDMLRRIHKSSAAGNEREVNSNPEP